MGTRPALQGLVIRPALGLVTRPALHLVTRPVFLRIGITKFRKILDPNLGSTEPWLVPVAVSDSQSGTSKTTENLGPYKLNGNCTFMGQAATFGAREGHRDVKITFNPQLSTDEQMQDVAR